MLTTWTVEGGRCLLQEGASPLTPAGATEPLPVPAAPIPAPEALRKAVWIDLT